jgi:hypothetical protein
MRNSLSLRLSICLNDVPIGPRIIKQEPLPIHQQTYEDTPSGREIANLHLEKIKQYLERNRECDGVKNPTKYINLK